MQFKKIFAMAAAASVLSVGMANATSVNFTFSNYVGNYAGTVTGHVDGLVDNATSAATAVWIDSYPVGLNQFGAYGTPFNVLTWSGGSLIENSFTLSGGLITAAFFSLTGANGVSDQLYLNSACACAFGTGHTNFLNIGNNDTQYVWSVGNLGAADGIIFGDRGGAVPEPATWALMITGFGLVGATLRRRRAVAA